MFRRSSFFLTKKYDVCVIGGGPAGIAAAIRAYDFGKKACIIEAEKIGGADFWNGALQSKTLWEMAKFSNTMRRTIERKILSPLKELPPIKHENIQKAITEVAEIRERQAVKQIEASKIDILRGFGSFETPNTISIKNGGSSQTIEADNIIIAAGAKPRKHQTAVADGKVIFTSDDIMMQPFPKSIVIIGAGVIGCEFASIFANFGFTKVHIIEKNNRILPVEDEDVSLFVQSLLEKKGVCIHHRSEMIENKVENGMFKYTLRDLRNGELHTYEVEKALVSIGRVPNTGNLNLKAIGVEVKNGKLDRDAHFRVMPHKHIYSCGDVSTRVALVNVGQLEGRSCVEHMYTPYPEAQNIAKLDNLSTIMFLDQEVAAVGLNEMQCRANNIAYKMAKYGYEFVGRALAMGNTNGFVKLIVTNDKKMQVLGVRAVGLHASSIVEFATLAIANHESIFNLSELRVAYPTVSHGFQECVHTLLGSSTLKPNVFPQIVVEEWTPSNFTRGRAYQKAN
eukprot:gene452-235_t